MATTQDKGAVSSAPVYVLIRSAEAPLRFVVLNGRGINKFEPAGSGKAVNYKGRYFPDIAVFILETFSDGTVAFKSAIFPNVYLRLEGREGAAGTKVAKGFGTVNGQFGRYSHETFKIVPAPVGVPLPLPPLHAPTIAIESVAFPGRFLRLDADTDVVNVQGVPRTFEHLEIVVLGDRSWKDYELPSTELP
ncbi:hypothetical protein BGX38DRAFT_1228189 [Terfezia claveryi]|nr:hypothetical protein BGX38DRAFT_1228189 [Terfezia claveryi]